MFNFFKKPLAQDARTFFVFGSRVDKTATVFRVKAESKSQSDKIFAYLQKEGWVNPPDESNKDFVLNPVGPKFG